MNDEQLRILNECTCGYHHTTRGVDPCAHHPGSPCTKCGCHLAFEEDFALPGHDHICGGCFRQLEHDLGSPEEEARQVALMHSSLVTLHNLTQYYLPFDNRLSQVEGCAMQVNVRGRGNVLISQILREIADELDSWPSNPG